MATRAEELSFDGVFFSGHLTLPTARRSRYPYRSDGSFPLRPDQNVLEPVTEATYLAAVTERVHLGFSVLVLPYRHPVLAAKMIATLDVLSQGRVILGVGAGWLEEEFLALGANFPDRGQVTDEHIHLMKTLWTLDEPDFKGQHNSLSGMTMYPKPAQKPHPPIWTGGISQRALRRAARLSDGWHAIRLTPDGIKEVHSQLKQYRKQSGQTFSGYVRSRRLERCRNDLASPLYAHLSITEICYRWGFNASAHFSRAFREQFKQSPRDYRREQAGTLPAAD